MITMDKRSKAYMLCILTMANLFCQVYAEEPDWVTGLGKSDRFPGSRFFTGFGMSTSNDNKLTDEKIDEAKNSAKSSLVEGMEVRVQVQNSNGTSVRSTRSGRQELRSDYRSEVVSTSDIDIEGIEYEVYQSKARRPVYALAYIDKEKVVEKYSRELESRVSLLEELQSRIQEFIKQGDIIAAQEQDDECQNILDKIDTILSAMEIIGEASFRPTLTAIRSRALEIHQLVAGYRTGSDFPLRMSLWTSEGMDKVRLERGSFLTVFVRVNKPCYLHLLCRLGDNFWTIPGYRYWNFYFDEKSAGSDVALPDSFMAALPAGTDTLQAIVSEAPWALCEFMPTEIGGEDYLVIPRSCVPSNVKDRDGASNTFSTHSVLIMTHN